jgi:hypothetical protein
VIPPPRETGFTGLPQNRENLYHVVAAIIVFAVTISALAWLARPIGKGQEGTLTPRDGISSSYMDRDAWVTREHSVSTSSQVLSSGPEFVILAMRPEDLGGTDRAWWREFTTRTSPAGLEKQLTLRRLRSGSVEKTLVVGPGKALRIFQPGLPELPADARPGTQWEADGQVRISSDQEKVFEAPWRYRAKGSAPQDPGQAASGCLRVTSELEIDGKTEEEDQTWCPGLGPVSTASSQPVTVPPLRLARDLDWRVEDWNPTSTPLSLKEPMTWPAELPPVGDRAVMVAAHRTAGDLLFMGSGDETFRAHPGGYVTSLTRQGDLVLATSTTPEAAGYDLQGRPRWRTRLPDTVPFAPDWQESKVVMVDAGGTATALDGATGSILWQQDLDASPAAKAIWCGDQVMVPTGDGLTGLDAQSGETTWSIELHGRPGSVACVAGHIVAAVNPLLVLVSPDGKLLSDHPLEEDNLGELLNVDDTLVMRSKNTVRGFSLDGDRLRATWQAQGRFHSAATDGHVIAALSSDALIALDSSGSQLGSWPMTTTDTNLTLGTLQHGVAALGMDDIVRKSS